MARQQLDVILKLHDQLSKTVTGVQSRMKKFANSVKTDMLQVAAKIYVLQQAFRAVSRTIGAVVEAANRQEDATMRLNNALKLQGEFTHEVANDYAEFAKEMQKSTRFGNEAIQELMQQLISVGSVAPDQMERATKAAVDFAAATGRDLKTAALTVGKAMTGFTGELSRYGIIIDQNIPKTEKARAALEAMERQFGGFAQRDVETFSGKVDQLANSWSDLQEELGKFITNSDLVAESLEKINVAIDFYTDMIERSNRQRLADGLVGDLQMKLQDVNRELERQQELLGTSWFGVEREKREARINNLLAERSRILLTLRRVQSEQAAEEEEPLKEAESQFKDFEEAIQNELDKFKEVQKIAAGIIIKQAEMVSTSFGNAMANMIVYGKSFTESMEAAFKKMAATFIAEVSAMIAKWLAFLALKKAASVFGLFHEGGVVGKPSVGVMLESPFSKDSKFYHSGGAIRAHRGLAVDEVPIIAQTGEGILSRQGMKNIGGATGLEAINEGHAGHDGDTNINIEIYYPRMSKRTEVEGLARMLGAEIQRQSQYARAL